MISLTERFDEAATAAFRAALEPLAPLIDDEALTNEVSDLLASAAQTGQVSALLAAADSLGDRFLDEVMFTLEQTPPDLAWILFRRGLAAIPPERLRAPRSQWWARLKATQKRMGSLPRAIEFDLCAASALADEGQLAQAIALVRACATRAPNDFDYHSEEVALCELHLATLLHRAGGDEDEISARLSEAESVARGLPELSQWQMLSDLARVCLHLGRVSQGLALFEPLVSTGHLQPMFRRAVPSLPFRSGELSPVETAVTDLFVSFGFKNPSYLAWMNLARLAHALEGANRVEEARAVEAVTLKLIELDLKNRDQVAWDEVDAALDALRRHQFSSAAGFLTRFRARPR